VSADESRLKRWSRRKEQVRTGAGEDQPRKRGAAAPVADAVADTVAEQEMQTGQTGPRLTAKGFVQPLPPLAGPEEGEAPYEAAPEDALALLRENDAEKAALKAFPVRPEDEGSDREVDDGDIELTPEQEEAVRNLPPIDSLKEKSDFTPFFASNVPDFLKRQAYKALWKSSPFFNFRDGMNDYDENYRLIDKLITAADSAYKPGKGYGLEDDDREDDAGDGDDGGEEVAEEASGGEDADREMAADDGGKAEDETPKEPRKSDVRPPDDAV